MRKKNIFMVQIASNENATWQGWATWVEKKETVAFRSMLELIRMIDNVIQLEDESSQEVKAGD